VATLVKAAQHMSALSPEEAICALADTQGSVGEVVIRLKSLEFCSELKLVAR
jgi:hypothetical protein